MKIMQKPTRVLAKKLWHIVKVLCYKFHKTVSKHKLMLVLSLRLLLERSQKVAIKAIGNLLRTSHHHHDKLYHDRYDHVSDIVKAFEMLTSNESTGGDNYNVVACFLTPKVQPVRVTDSPFPIKEEEGEGRSQVDREAEEFIKRFYEQLLLQE